MLPCDTVREKIVIHEMWHRRGCTAAFACGCYRGGVPDGLVRENISVTKLLELIDHYAQTERENEMGEKRERVYVGGAKQGSFTDVAAH